MVDSTLPDAAEVELVELTLFDGGLNFLDNIGVLLITDGGGGAVLSSWQAGLSWLRVSGAACLVVTAFLFEGGRMSSCEPDVDQFFAAVRPIILSCRQQRKRSLTAVVEQPAVAAEEHPQDRSRLGKVSNFHRFCPLSQIIAEQTGQSTR